MSRSQPLRYKDCQNRPQPAKGKIMQVQRTTLRALAAVVPADEAIEIPHLLFAGSGGIATESMSDQKLRRQRFLNPLAETRTNSGCGSAIQSCRFLTG